MNSPKKRTSKILQELEQELDPQERAHTLRSMMLSARIANELKKKGWGKLEFSKYMDKTPSTVSRWLSGTHNFTCDTLEDIGAVLGINFFSDEKEKNGWVIASGNVTINVFRALPDLSELTEDYKSVPIGNAQVVMTCDTSNN
jgi:transcriptional regulator with XRE-family HTH domain